MTALGKTNKRKGIGDHSVGPGAVRTQSSRIVRATKHPGPGARRR